MLGGSGGEGETGGGGGGGGDGRWEEEEMTCVRQSSGLGLGTEIRAVRFGLVTAQPFVHTVAAYKKQSVVF